MPLVDTERASELDKIHTARMFHAFGQLVLNLVALEDERVNAVLLHKSICVFPGPVVALEYAPGDRQILIGRLVAANKAVADAAKPVVKPKAKQKRKR